MLWRIRSTLAALSPELRAHAVRKALRSTVHSGRRSRDEAGWITGCIGIRSGRISALIALAVLVRQPKPTVFFPGGYASKRHPQVIQRHMDVLYLLSRVEGAGA
jgi:hypothetical protein